MMMRLCWIVGCMFTVAGFAAAVKGAVLAGWEVDGVDVADGVGIETNAAPYTFYATTSDFVHVQAELTLGSGVAPSTTANQYGFKIAGAAETNSLAGAIASDHYIECVVSVAAGYQLNFDSIELVGQGSSGGCSNVVLMTSIDGFVTGKEIASAYPANVTGGFDTDSSGFGAPIDLSAPKYQHVTGDVSFRIYGWNSTSGSSPTYIRNLAGDDLVVYGEVAPLSGAGMPSLTMVHSNGTASVAVEFDGVSTTNYVLQSVGSLTNSNGWASVSASFSSSTNWMVETTNTAAFYRVVPE